MAPKRPSNSTARGYTVKQSRKMLSTQQKSEVLRRYGLGEKTSSISSALGLHESSVRHYWEEVVKNSPTLPKSVPSDVKAAKKFSASLNAIITKGGYTAKQVFIIDESILYWKKLPGRTFISEKESTEPGFKASQDRLTLLLGANAEGDYRLKPALVYHSENPLGSKGYAEALLPYYWYSNPNSLLTEQISNDYFSEKLHKELKCYCEREGISFKILICIGNTASHPPKGEVLSDNVRIFILPPNTASVLQPCDQGIIQIFKSYYLRIFVKHLVQDANENNISLLDCWKAFIINDAIDFIKSVWEVIPRSCLKEVWVTLCPRLVPNFTGPSIKEIVALANGETQSMLRDAGFTGVHDKDIEDLIKMGNEQEKEMEGTADRMLETKSLEKALNRIREGLQMLTDKDPEVERSLQVARNVRKNIACYEKILENWNEKSTE